MSIAQALSSLSCGGVPVYPPVSEFPQELCWFEYDVPRVLGPLNTESPLDGSVRGGLGGVHLLKEVYHWEKALRV